MRRFVTVLQGDVRAGDRWLVQSVDPETGATVFVRQEAEPGQFRRRGDGLWPPLPDATPVSDAEARAIADQMDEALKSGAAFIRDEAPFLPAEEVSPGLQCALERGWARPAHEGR